MVVWLYFHLVVTAWSETPADTGDACPSSGIARGAETLEHLERWTDVILKSGLSGPTAPGAPSNKAPSPELARYYQLCRESVRLIHEETFRRRALWDGERRSTIQRIGGSEGLGLRVQLKTTEDSFRDLALHHEDDHWALLVAFMGQRRRARFVSQESRSVQVAIGCRQSCGRFVDAVAREVKGPSSPDPHPLARAAEDAKFLCVDPPPAALANEPPSLMTRSLGALVAAGRDANSCRYHFADLGRRIAGSSGFGATSPVDSTEEGIRGARDAGVSSAGSPSAAPRGAGFARPVNCPASRRGFGMRIHPITGRLKFHAGQDFPCARGTPVRATADGVVTFKSSMGGYGKTIDIRHDKRSGLSSRYAHLHRFAPTLKNGARVRRGDIIGYVGSTGLSTGNHLHFEIRRWGRAVNPMTYIGAHRRLAGSKGRGK